MSKVPRKYKLEPNRSKAHLKKKWKDFSIAEIWKLKLNKSDEVFCTFLYYIKGINVKRIKVLLKITDVEMKRSMRKEKEVILHLNSYQKWNQFVT